MNPLTRIVDYRIRVFSVFHSRAKDVNDLLLLNILVFILSIRFG
jgi:hypothetical protein